MRTVFADAAYWIALFYPKDSLSRRAHEFAEKLADCRIVTSEMVLVEALNSLSRVSPQLRRRAVNSIRSLMLDPNVDIIAQTSEQFREALADYGKVEDKQWGLTDCASFAIMRGMGLSEALTHDRHFAQAGFAALLRE